MNFFFSQIMFRFLYNQASILLIKTNTFSVLFLLSYISTLDFQRNIRLQNVFRESEETTFDQLNQIENVIRLRYKFFEDFNRYFNNIKKIKTHSKGTIEAKQDKTIGLYLYHVEKFYCLFEKNPIYLSFRDTIEAINIVMPHFNFTLFDYHLYLNTLLHTDDHDSSANNDKIFIWRKINFHYKNYVFCPLRKTFADDAGFAYCEKFLLEGILDEEYFVEEFKNLNIITSCVGNGYKIEDLKMLEWKSSFFLGKNHYLRVFWLLDMNEKVKGNITTLRNTNNKR